MAERAIRQLAVQRKISGSFFKRVAPQYLLLLAISQTCRFQGKSFLKFLLSKEGHGTIKTVVTNAATGQSTLNSAPVDRV